MKGRGNFRPMPADFPEKAHWKNAALMQHYHVGWEVLTRWKDLCGTSKRRNLPVIRISEDGSTQRFENVKSAAQTIFAGSVSNIYHALRTGGKAYGFYWRHADEEDP